MKVKFVRLNETARIITKTGYSENNYLDDKLYDLELISFSHFLVKDKSKNDVLAVIPFGRCNYFYPADSQELSSLDELTNTLDDTELYDDPANFFPQSNKGKGKAKGLDGSKPSATIKDI